MTTFDVNDPTYGEFCAGFAELAGELGELKLVLTDEDWCPNWALPGDDRPRALVIIRPVNVTGRGPNPDAGWRVEVTGGDDTAMIRDLDGPGQGDAARTLYDAIVDGTTRAQLAALGFTNE